MTDATTPEQPPCDNCGEPIVAHCSRHVIPCCPHYPQHEAQARPAVASEATNASNCPICGSAMIGDQTERIVAFLALHRPAVASEGLRAALEVIAGISENRVTLEQADALGYLDGYLQDLASDAGSVGALPLASAEVNGLDVERLARALRAMAADNYGEEWYPVGGQAEAYAEAIAAAYDAERQGESE